MGLVAIRAGPAAISGWSSEETDAPQSGFGTPETLRSGGRVHVLGAGPVGLLLAALLQP